MPYKNTYEKLLKNISETIGQFSKVAGCKMNIQISEFSINSNNNELEIHNWRKDLIYSAMQSEEEKERERRENT